MSAPSPAKKPGSRLRRALWALPLLGLVELGAHFYFAGRAPAFDDWYALREPIAGTKRPGEIVVVAPSWADPLARRALGDDLMPLRDVGTSDVTTYDSALEISILGQRARELEGFHEVEQKQIGRFTVRRLENPSPERVVYDFTDHVGPAFADVRGTDPEVACAWNPNARIEAGGLGGHPTFPAQRFECPGGPFFNVGVTVIADEEFRPRRCIWSHPFRRGEIVTRFHDVPLGSALRGHHGMYWIIERELKGAPITLTVRIDGAVVGSATHTDGDGWSAFAMPLGDRKGTVAREVEFAVSSPEYKDRHYCFEADTR